MNCFIVSCSLSMPPIAPCIELLYSSEAIVLLASALTLVSHCESMSRHSAIGSVSFSFSAISDGRRLAGAAFRLFLVQRGLEDLADRRLRQRVAELDHRHHLVLAELVLEEILQLVERERLRAFLEGYERYRRLTAVLVGDAD